MPTAPPVEHWITTRLPAARIRSTISRKCCGSCDGRPSGQRAWRWTTAAPARPASTAARAISSGVYGTCGLWARVTSAPTTAAATITFSPMASSAAEPLLLPGHHARPPGATDDHRLREDLGRAVGQVGPRPDHLARLEAHRARGVPHRDDLGLDLEEVAGVRRREQLDRLVRAQEPLVAVMADAELGRGVAEQREDARAVHEVAAVVGVLLGHADPEDGLRRRAHQCISLPIRRSTAPTMKLATSEGRVPAPKPAS